MLASSRITPRGEIIKARGMELKWNNTGGMT